jgi:glutathione synthase/RimK-type ligase-like ATP-grasp enzyme
MQKGLVIGCRKTRQTARLIAEKAGWAYTETYVDSLADYSKVFRYGNSSELNMEQPDGSFGSLDRCANNYTVTLINKAHNIKYATDKLVTRNLLRDNGLAVPYTIQCEDGESPIWPDIFPAVIRPLFHMKGHSFQIANNMAELTQYWRTGFYCSELILKREEFRVIGLWGKVLEVNSKVKVRDDADEIIRNHGHGWKFKWIPYSEAERTIVANALKAIRILGLDFGAVDLCVDASGRAVTFEVNTAPGMVERKATKLAEKLNAE